MAHIKSLKNWNYFVYAKLSISFQQQQKSYTTSEKSIEILKQHTNESHINIQTAMESEIKEKQQKFGLPFFFCAQILQRKKTQN